MRNSWALALHVLGGSLKKVKLIYSTYGVKSIRIENFKMLQLMEINHCRGET